MYNFIIDNSQKMSILAKIIKNNNTINCSEIVFTLNLSNDLLNKKTITKEIIEYNKEITEISFIYLSDDYINFENLYSLPNLSTLYFIDYKNSFLPEQLFILTNLKELNISTSIINYNVNEHKKYNITNLNELDKLENLESLTLEMDLIEFPKSILNLKNLKELNVLTKNILIIPNKLCNLDKLITLKINNPHTNTLIYENKMIIFDWKTSLNEEDIYDGITIKRNIIVDIYIPPEIDNLKIFNICYNLLDNLPSQINFLLLGKNINFPLNNLPPVLKKLVITHQDFYEQLYIRNNVKLPFDCDITII
jgi:hypothetical protein